MFTEWLMELLPTLQDRFWHRECIICHEKFYPCISVAPELDKIMQTQDVSIGIGVPIVADDHEMMGVVYRFNSMEHWKAVDAMVENQEFVSIVEKANSGNTKILKNTGFHASYIYVKADTVRPLITKLHKKIKNGLKKIGELE